MAHVFISYVRENQRLVDRLAKELRALGVEVWLDRDHIEPGQRWRVAIRRAISSGSLFVACFSREGSTRSKSYMNEELALAVDELRQRASDRTWFIPVRLDDSEVPDREIGGGETLRDLQWLDMTDSWSDAVQAIAQAAARNSETRTPVALHDGTNPNDETSIRANYFGQLLRTCRLHPCSEVRPLLYDDLEAIVEASEDGNQVSPVEIISNTIARTQRRFSLDHVDYSWSQVTELLQKLLNRQSVLLSRNREPLTAAVGNSGGPVVSLVADWRLLLDGEFVIELVRADARLELRDMAALTDVLLPPKTKWNEWYVRHVVDKLVEIDVLKFSRGPSGPALHFRRPAG